MEGKETTERSGSGNVAAAAKTGGNHLRYLDGVRGVAALIVVFHHFANAFFPALVGGTAAVVHTRFDLALYSSPLNIISAGNFAVTLFFVLSGFVLTRKFFQTGKAEVIHSSAGRRYFRLMPSILGSVLISYLLVVLGLMEFRHLAALTGAPMWEFLHTPLSTNFWAAIKEGLWGSMITGSKAFNSPLWTMQIEFLGSFLVFAVALLFSRTPLRWMVYAALILALWKTYYLAFILGLIMSDLSASGRLRLWPSRPEYVWGTLGLGLFLGSYPGGVVDGTMYEALAMGRGQSEGLAVLWHIIGSALALVALMNLPLAQRFFTHRWSQFLGRISFPLYLTHMLILLALSGRIFEWMLPHTGYVAAAAIAFEITLPLMLVAAYFYTRYIDEPAISASASLWKAINRPGASAADFARVPGAWARASAARAALLLPSRLRPGS